MKKVIISLALLTGLVVVAKRFAPKMQDVDWERMFENMPENAPPKWMFRNITAIRENTERILDVLERERSEARTAATAASTPGPTGST